jgi:two-component sensor histidine kinase
VARDITEHRRAIEQQNLLLGEMRHRVKNLAAVIDAIARQSRPQDEPAVDEFVDVFIARIRALLSTGELTLGSPARTVELNQLLAKVLEPFVDPKGAKGIAFRGPTLVVSEQTAGGLGLAFHELATNAVKYGALKIPSGRVDIEWSIRSSGGKSSVQIDWKESGGEPVTPNPSRRGFGSRVIGQAVAREPDSRTDLSFEKDGLRCRFEFTMDAIHS